MEKQTMLLLSLLLLGCFSIHAECRAVMDEMGNQKVCIYSDCRGRYSKADCWCCAKNKDACFPGLDECETRCPVLT
ncbi:hypothetical protein PVAP13_4KG310500 [Panicum virgatum]|uniref:Meg domain-containing protein n=1 Tax=Panicum virgatum TaxID=38727 RepID=A0A8T0TVK2_PANVG|nr:hypothetical protein PVAP13_4KG310500 [Panicum virgatum]